MRTVHAMLSFVVIRYQSILPIFFRNMPYDCPIASEGAVKIMGKTSHESLQADGITTFKQSMIKLVAYFMGYSVKTPQFRMY